MTGKWEKEFLEEGFVRSIDGTEFTGEFMNDGSFKQGTYLDINGDRYTGYFKNNNFHGFGILRKKTEPSTLELLKMECILLTEYFVNLTTQFIQESLKMVFQMGKESKRSVRSCVYRFLVEGEKEGWDLWISETELVLLESSKMV